MASLRLAAGAALVLWGLSSGAALAGAGLVLLGIVVGSAPLARLLPGGTLRLARGLPAVVAGMGIINFAFMGADSFVPYALTNLRGQSSLMAGLVITTAALSWTGGAWVVERYAERFSRRAFVMVGMAHLITLSEAKAGTEGEATSALKLAEWLGSAAGAGIAGAIVAAGTASGWQGWRGFLELRTDGGGRAVRGGGGGAAPGRVRNYH